MEPTLHEWTATWRLDMEDLFATDSIAYRLPTCVLSEAAALIEKELGGSVTLFSLVRSDI